MGTKTFCAALKTVQIGIKYATTRRMIQEHINCILFELSLPLMLMSQAEFDMWQENPIEYVRMQVDQSNPFNPKAIVKTLVKCITGIKGKRKDKVGEYLQQYLQVLATNLETPNEDFRVKEAIFHSLGNLSDHISGSHALQSSLEPLLQSYVFSELSSPNPILRSRAIWLYGRFGALPACFKSATGQEHLRHVLNAVYENLAHTDLPVRVEAALALNALLEHELAVEFLRPGLEMLLKTYLKIMDDIDFDGLVEALRKLVDVYQEEIAPYAVALCQKLGEAYLRLLAAKGTGEEEDQETSLTADGLMTAIVRVL